jgi:hypothetical protein
VQIIMCKKFITLAFLLLIGCSSSAWAVNYSLDFDGTNDWVKLGDIDAFDGASAFSINWWFNSNGGDTIHMFSKRQSGNRGIQMKIRPDKGYLLSVETGSDGYGYTGTFPPNNEWVHATMVFNGAGASNADRLKFYINGSLQSLTFVGTVSSTTPVNSEQMLISGRDNSGGKFDGKIDEISFFNKSLSADEVTALYNDGTPLSAVSNSGSYVSSSHLFAYYTMDSNSGTGTSLTDDSTQSNTGTLTNMDSTDWMAFDTTQSLTSTTIAEGETTTLYNVKLNQQPTANVTLLLTHGDPGAVTLSTGSLAFTPSNWSTPQTVSITGTSDDDVTDESITITHSLSGGGYAGASVTDLVVTVTDDDTQTVTQSATSATFDEASASTYTLVLNTQPTGSVTVALTSSDAAAASVSPSTLTFTTSDWSSAQTVTVSGVNDDDETNETVTISHTISGGDYGSVAVADYTASINDDDDRIDSIAPIMTITAAEVADGDASDHATLALTFTSNEATTNFFSADITVTNASLSNFSATSSSVYTANLTPTGEGDVTVAIAAGTFSDAASNNNTAATQFNWTYLKDPTTKKDVISGIGATVDIASQWTQSTFLAISHRLSWLKNQKDQTNRSFQGIRLDFNDATINALMAAPSASLTKTNWTSAAVNQVTRANDSWSTLQTNVGIEATKAAINEVAIMRENATGTLNPAFKPILNGWSLWTAGQVEIGKANATSSSSKQDSKAHSITIGLDKPMDDKSLMGFVLRTGQGRAYIGTSTSKVTSESYSFSGYHAYESDDSLLIEAVTGVGVVKYNLTRADGIETLTGGRSANQAFASFTLNKPTTVFGKLSLSPFLKATYSHTSFGAYSESSGATALTYKEHAINETQLGLGTEARYQLFVGNTKVHPYARVSYSLDVSDHANVPAQMYHNSNPAKIYSLALDKRSTGSVQFALGANLTTMGGVNASLDYGRNTVFNAGHVQSASVRIGKAF